MNAERARLLRLNRLERIRAIARQAAALESAEAESTLAQLHALAERTSNLANDYAGRSGLQDAAALQQHGSFVGILRGISGRTTQDADQAREIANAKLTALGIAERRRAVVEERADKQARSMATRGTAEPSGPRRSLGTGLE